MNSLFSFITAALVGSATLTTVSAVCVPTGDICRPVFDTASSFVLQSSRSREFRLLYYIEDSDVISKCIILTARLVWQAEEVTTDNFSFVDLAVCRLYLFHIFAITPEIDRPRRMQLRPKLGPLRAWIMAIPPPLFPRDLLLLSVLTATVDRLTLTNAQRLWLALRTKPHR